jgi:4-alpha-glucanotransferase
MSINLSENKIINSRRAGVMMPLFSMRSVGDWGCGDLDSLKEWISCFSRFGIKILQILPANEISAGENCPYSAMSAFAVDPVYISVKDIKEVRESVHIQGVIAQMREDIAFWRSQSVVRYSDVKAAKYKVLWLAYRRFVDEEKSKNTPRFADFANFYEKESAWLAPYCVFRAEKDFTGWTNWKEWQSPVKDARAEDIKNFIAGNKEQTEFFCYIQWLLQKQIAEVRALARAKDVLLFGDIPFGSAFDSADVWLNRDKYMLNAEIGAPADDMACDGQRWGLPAYNWPLIQKDDFSLWRDKIKRACAIYDIFRLDHMVGFFRTWIFDRAGGKGYYDITDESLQKNRGMAFLQAAIEAAGGALPVGEDLGVIPDYMRTLMRENGIAGFKVLMWERDNGAYCDPKNYPKASLATTSTHDTETLSGWWDNMQKWDKAALWQMLSGQATDGNIPFGFDVQKMIFKRLFDGASCMVVIPVSDITGSKERINVPGTVSADNWSRRIECEPEEFVKKYFKEMETFRELIYSSGR